MTDFPGFASPSFGAVLAGFTGRVARAFESNRDTYAPAYDGILALAAAIVFAADPVAGGGGGGPPGNTHVGHRSDTYNAGDLWFEHPHVLQRSYVFGNIVSTITTVIEVFNAFRHSTISLSALVNNAGAGVSPDFSPPESIPPLSSLLDGSSTPTVPVARDLIVTTEGPARFDTTLDFVFSSGHTIKVPVSGDRIAFFPIEFDGDGTVTETLSFGTDVLPSLDGGSQRVSFRKNPRQRLSGPVVVDGRARREIEALLFGWQSRSFGVGVWHERMTSTAAVSAGAVVIPAVTAWVDLRVGQLVAIVTDSRTYDVVTVLSFDSTSITLVSSLLNAYPAGSFVVPVRVGRMAQVISGKRYATSVERWILDFLIDSNDVDSSFASAAAFSTYGGKILLDDCQVMQSDSGVDVSYRTRVRVIDNNTGIVYQTTDWDRSERNHIKGFQVSTRQQLYELRQLLHEIRGQQQSFYLPTFADELIVTQTMSIGTATVTVDNIGFARYVVSRAPRNILKVTFTDGTSLIRVVQAAIALSATEEQLTLDTTWPATRLAGEVSRVQYYEETIFASDEIVIEHLGIGLARVFVPVRAVP